MHLHHRIAFSAAALEAGRGPLARPTRRPCDSRRDGSASVVSTLPRGISSGRKSGRFSAVPGKRDFQQLIATLDGAHAGAQILWLERNGFAPRDKAAGQCPGDDRSAAVHGENTIDEEARLAALHARRKCLHRLAPAFALSSSRPVPARADVGTIGISPNDVPRSRSRTSAAIRAGSPRSHFVIATTPCRTPRCCRICRVFLRLRHPAVVRGDGEQRGVDAPTPAIMLGMKSSWPGTSITPRERPGSARWAKPSHRS